MELVHKAIDTNLTDNDVVRLEKRNVAAVAVTVGGGMGTPGEVVVYYRRKDDILVARGNYVYGDIDMGLLKEKLGLFDKSGGDWKEFYMGCGNSLLVNSADYPELAKKFEGKCDEDIGDIHYAEIMNALSGTVSHSGNKRQRNRAIAAETMQIIKNGYYEMDGERIEFDFFQGQLEEVQLLEPDDIEELVDNDDGYLDDSSQEYSKCEYLVVNMDSFEANYRYALSDRALVMNFASALHPGGGFMNGASAQEESLCRNSTLFASIGSKKARAMYDYNKEDGAPFYSDYMLLSPYVTVFRNPAGELMRNKFNTAVITVPAINMKRLSGNVGRQRIPAVMENRIERMLCAAIREDYDTLILGAWGCGAFGHDAKDVAGYFKDVIINRKYYKFFKKIIFAVYDTSKGQYNYRSFCEIFGEQGVWNTEVSDEMI